MIDSNLATIVLIGFLLVFGIIIPILDKIPFVRSFISFRWLIIVIYSSMALGAIIDFDHLDDSVRFVVVLGGILLSALLVIIRSLEKAAINEWHLPHTRAKISKGDVEASLSVCPKAEVEPIVVDPEIDKALNEENHISK